MTILKRLFTMLIVSGVIGFTAQALSMVSFDYSLLRPLITRSQQAVETVAASLNPTKAACIDQKAFAKNLYTQQKNALKLIKAELKQAYKSSKLRGLATWFAERQLYKAYKKFVYKNWKKTRLFPAF